MINLEVKIMNQLYQVQCNPQNTFHALVDQQLKQLNFNEADVKQIIYVNDQQIDPKDTIQSKISNKKNLIQVALSKQHDFNIKNNVLGELKVRCNLFASIAELLRSITRQISKKNLSQQFDIKIIFNGIEQQPETIWYSLSPINQVQFLFETQIQFNYQGKTESLVIDVDWTGHQVISQINQKLNLQDNILLLYKDQELLPEEQFFTEKIPANAIYTLKLQQNVKFRLQNNQNGVKPINNIQINNNETIGNLEILIQETLQLPLKQRVILKVGQQQLDSTKTVKQEMIPFNCILNFEIIELPNIKIKLQNIKNKEIIEQEVDAQIQIKQIEKILSQGVQNLSEIKFYLNNSQSVDKNLTLDQIGLKRSQILIYEIKLNEPVIVPNNPALPSKKIQELDIIYQNIYNNNKTRFLVNSEKVISENFEKAIKNEDQKKISDYKITYNNVDLNINQTYEQANIQNSSVITYYCLIRNIKFKYSQQVFESNERITERLSTVEAQLRQKYNIPNNWTIFHSKFQTFKEKTVEQIGFLDTLEFKELSKPKIVQIFNPEPMRILKFKIAIQDLGGLEILQEIPANNQIRGLADCLRHKLQLPKNSRIKFFLGQEFFDDKDSLENIMEGRQFETLSVSILNNITVNFKNRKTQQKIAKLVLLAEKLKETAANLKLENATFYYNDQIIKQTNQSYEEMLIMHDDFIFYELPVPIEQPIQQLVEQQAKQPIQQKISRPVPVQQSINQPVHQSINQPVQQLINEPNQKSNSIYKPSNSSQQQIKEQIIQQSKQPGEINANQEDENELFQPPESEYINSKQEFKQPKPEQNSKIMQIEISVVVGGKTMRFQLDPKTTAKELNDMLHNQTAYNKAEKGRYCVYFNSQLLRDDVEIGSLAQQNKEIQLQYIEISRYIKY